MKATLSHNREYFFDTLRTIMGLDWASHLNTRVFARKRRRKKAHGLVKNKNYFSQDPQAQIQIRHLSTIRYLEALLELRLI